MINIMKRLMCIFSAFCFFGCNPKPLTASDFPGIYNGYYGGAEEVFELHDNGTFSQTLHLYGKEIYTNSGTWKIVNKPESRLFLAISKAPKIIVFNHFFKSMDSMTGNLQNPPKLVNGQQGDWDSSHQSIELWKESGYIIFKQRP